MVQFFCVNASNLASFIACCWRILLFWNFFQNRIHLPYLSLLRLLVVERSQVVGDGRALRCCELLGVKVLGRDRHEDKFAVDILDLKQAVRDRAGQQSVATIDQETSAFLAEDLLDDSVGFDVANQISKLLLRFHWEDFGDWMKPCKLSVDA